MALIAVFALLFCGSGCSAIKNGIDSVISLFHKETVRLTFPEGSTVAEMALILEEGGVCTAEEFRAQANNVALLSEYGFEIETPKNRAFALEGYLFPDTYDFYVGEGAETAIGRFLKNTQKKLGDDILEQCAQSGFSLDEILAIASVIQEETGFVSEMGKVSSVLHNRLASASFSKLQCDVTIHYINDYVTNSKYLSGDTTNYAELYNTYKCDGLPAGPITNPGLAAIEAALYPAETNYYYFVTDSEWNYYYASTYAQHQANCNKAGIKG